MIDEIKIDRLEELIHEMMIKIRDTYPTNSAEGNPIEIENAAAAPLVKCVTAITGSQSGSGTPSAENIRPIVAYDNNSIYVVGHNISDEDYEPGYIDIDTGEDARSNDTKRTKNYIKIKPNTRYCFVSSAVSNVRMIFYGADKSYIGKFGNNDPNPQVFTTPNNAYFLRYYIGNNINAGVNYPSNVTTYEPYNGTTYTTTFTSPIYKGTVDVVTGKVTAEWGYIATYNGETLPGLWISDRDEYDPESSPTEGAQVAYELASPTTITETLSNAPISSIHGYNHIESSTGDMEMTYITEEFEPLANVPTT